MQKRFLTTPHFFVHIKNSYFIVYLTFNHKCSIFLHERIFAHLRKRGKRNYFEWRYYIQKLMVGEFRISHVFCQNFCIAKINRRIRYDRPLFFKNLNKEIPLWRWRGVAGECRRCFGLVLHKIQSNASEFRFSLISCCFNHFLACCIVF